MVITFILYVIGIPSIPARDSLIPNIAPNTINAAYSIITISTQIAHLVGPLLAALLVFYFNINYLFFFISSHQKTHREKRFLRNRNRSTKRKN